MKEQILSLLSSESKKEQYLLNAIKDLSPPSENPHFYSQLLELFVHLVVEEDQARSYWKGILKNYNHLNDKMDRNVGIRVAIIDYFMNLNKMLDSPILVEIHIFKETEKLAMVDGLTGLFNRRYFDLTMNKELKRASRHDTDIALILMDIDNFKQINDTKGHLFGDDVLRRLGKLLRNVSREEDTVCRYGGEEFLVILPETTRDGGLIFAERFRELLHEDLFFRENNITLSGGIASYPYAGNSAEEILLKADQALYEAKYSGKDCFIKSENKNKRRRPRFQKTWHVWYHPLEKQHEKFGPRETFTQNVSLGGIGIELTEQFDLGTHFILDVDMPNGQTNIIGKIVWIKQNANKSFSYGIEFCDMKTDQRQMMMQILPSDFFDPEEKI